MLFFESKCANKVFVRKEVTTQVSYFCLLFSVAVLFTKYFLAVPFWCEVQATVEGTGECAKLL